MTQFTRLFVALALALQLRAAFVDVAEGPLNARHFMVTERDEDGSLVARSTVSKFTLIDRDEQGQLRRRACHTYNACGTAGGCAIMAGIQSCDSDKKNPKEAAKKHLNEAAKQSGANGGKALKIIAESAGRSPLGSVAGLAKTTASEIKDAKKQDKAAKKAAPPPPKKENKPAPKKNEKKKKRELVEEVVLNVRDFEVVERDEDLSFVKRSDYTLYDLYTRSDDEPFVVRECAVYNGVDSCM
jgi:hypothetical protein